MLVAVLVAGAALAPAAQAALISQGGVRMGADALWSRGFLGQGQTVAVVDEGFLGLDRSIALGELPPRDRMTIHVVDPIDPGLDGFTDVGVPTGHGVRMAELVHDIAPEAHLVLVRYRGIDDFPAAAAWVASQGIPIASHSHSFLEPPYDGTGPAARAVDAAAAAGVLWVNSSGNFAQRHWRGAAAPGGTVLPLPPTGGQPLVLSLSWSAPGVTASVAVERLDPSGAWTEVARGAPYGARGALTGPVPTDGGSWRVVVRQESGGPAAFDLYSRTIGFGPAAVPAGSVPTPGDAAGSLTVGAVRWNQDTLEAYSSYGPTIDGRAKPDLIAPTYVTSNPEWPSAAGTSAATAHVAGAAAILRQSRIAQGLPATAADLRGVLLSTALDLGPRGVDPMYGAGMARLDATAPAVRLRLGTGRTPALRVGARDAGTIRRIEIRLNRKILLSVRRPTAGVRLTRLARGRNTLEVTVEDMAGNRTVRTKVVRGRR